jgi:hypothetical protein
VSGAEPATRRPSGQPAWMLAGVVSLLLCCVSGTPPISPEGSAARETIAVQLTILGALSALVLGRSLLGSLGDHALASGLVYLGLALLAPLIAHGAVVLWYELGARVYPGSFLRDDDGRLVLGKLPEHGREVLGLLLFACLALAASPFALAVRLSRRRERG